MSDDTDDQPTYDPPGATVADEPDTLPEHPMTAADAEPFLAKNIG
jgi:hypothetical protein